MLISLVWILRNIVDITSHRWHSRDLLLTSSRRSQPKLSTLSKHDDVVKHYLTNVSLRNFFSNRSICKCVITNTSSSSTRIDNLRHAAYTYTFTRNRNFNDPEHVKPAVWRHNNSKTQRSGMSTRMCAASLIACDIVNRVWNAPHTHTHTRARCLTASRVERALTALMVVGDRCCRQLAPRAGLWREAADVGGLFTENFTSHRQTLRRDDDAATVYIIVCSNITSFVKQNKI